MAEPDLQVLPAPNPNDTAALIQDLRSLVVDCPDLRRLEQSLGRFNIFDVLRSTHTEIRHSNVLAWLFDPTGSHGMQNLFLRRFLMRVLHENHQEEDAPLDPVEVDSTPFRSVNIRREWKNIDVLIEILTEAGQKWVICLENKVGAGQGKGQLSRYRKTVETAFSDAERLYIFLTMRGEVPEDSAYITATYEQVAVVLDAGLAENEGTLGEGPKLLLNHYSTILKERFMDDSEAAKLAQQIYREHKHALDFIIQHVTDRMKLVSDRLVALLEQDQKNLGLVPKSHGKGLIRFVPKAWELQENYKNDESSAVFCEIAVSRGRSILKAYIGPDAPKAWREKLFTMRNEKAFSEHRSKKKSMPKWICFGEFSLPNWEKENKEPETAANDIWKKCVEEITSDRFKKMVGSVADVLTSSSAN